MKLAEFLQVENIKASHLAIRLGVSGSTITRILSGDRGPSWKLARKIAEITNNRVMPNDFIFVATDFKNDDEAA